MSDEQTQVFQGVLGEGQPSLPEGWVWTTVGDVVEFQYGKGLRKDKRDDKGNVPVFGSNGIVGYHSTALTKNSCLIVGRKGAAGAVHISNEPCYPIDTTYFIEPPEGINLNFLFHLLSTLNLSLLDKSTAIPGLNRNDAYRMPIPLPPLPEQHAIVEKIERRFSVIDEMDKVVDHSLSQAERLRQSILKQAFEGRLVPQDRTDEPASVLLERIKAEKATREVEGKTKKQKARQKKTDTTKKKSHLTELIK